MSSQTSTIENVVFDLGGVLIEWHPRRIVSSLFRKPAHVDRVLQEIFFHQRWRDFDAGKLDIPAAVSLFSRCTGLPEDDMKRLFEAYFKALTPFAYAVSLLETLRSKGYRLFALSNINGEVLSHLTHNYDLFRRFDGIIGSGNVGLSKPDPRLFEHLLSTYQLTASQTLLVDDTEENIVGAKAAGMRGILFTTPKDVLAALSGASTIL